MDFHPVVQKIKDLLEGGQVPYDYFEHEPVRTSEEASRIRPGYSLKQGAKALIVKLYLKSPADTACTSNTASITNIANTSSSNRQCPKEDFVMLVVPGDAKFDGKKVKKLLNAKDLRFATEEEVSNLTVGVQVGGVPPFGSLFGLTTYMDPQILQNDKIIFNAGDRQVSVAISSLDYVAVEQPEIVALTL